MKYTKYILLTVIFLTIAIVETTAQCPMCRMTVESNYAGGGSAGLGLNNGIMYLLAAPYLVVGTIAFFYWKNKRDEQFEEEQLT